MIRHPHALRDAALPSVVTVNGEDYPIGDDGVVDCPDAVADDLARVWSDQHDVDPAALRVRETCDVVKDDGDVCGRDRPCQYHD